MAKFLFLFFTLCVLQVSLAGRFVREEPNTLDDLAKQAADWLQNVGNQISEVAHAKDITEVQAVLKNGTDTLTSQLTGLVTELNSKLSEATSDQSTLIGKTVAKLNQTIEELKVANPEATAKVTDLNENFQKGLQTVQAEFDKVRQTFSENSEGIQSDLEKLTKQAYDGIVKSAQTVQQQLKDVAAKN